LAGHDELFIGEVESEVCRAHLLGIV